MASWGDVCRTSFFLSFLFSINLCASVCTHPSHLLSSGVEYDKGQSVKARILDLDLSRRILDVSLRTDLLKHCGATPDVAVGSKVKIRVELVKRNYLVASLSKVWSASSFNVCCASQEGVGVNDDKTLWF